LKRRVKSHIVVRRPRVNFKTSIKGKKESQPSVYISGTEEVIRH
jgi:hypothetical protein